MKKRQIPLYVLILTMTIAMSSCELVGDIFKAGFWSAFILIGLVIAVIIFIASRMRRKT